MSSPFFMVEVVCRNAKKNSLDVMLFCILLLVASYFYQGGFSNQNSRFDQALAIVYDHTLSIDSWHFNTIDKASSNGRYYSEKAPLSSYLIVPIVYGASFFVTSKDLVEQDQYAKALLYICTILSVGILWAFSGVALKKIMIIINPQSTPFKAFTLTLAIMLGSPIVVYSTMIFGHVISASLLVLGGYFLLRSCAMTSKKHGVFWTIGCFLLGLAVLSEFPVACIAIGVYISCVLYRKTSRKLTSYLSIENDMGGWLAGAVSAVVLMMHNWMAFGGPFQMGYGQLSQTTFAQGMSQGMFGVTLPSIQNLAQLLFGSYRGLFVYAPILCLAIVGYVKRMQSDKWMAPLLIGCACLLLVNSSYTYWQGGSCFGPRHLVPAIPFVGLGLVFLDHNRWNVLLASFLGAISIVINSFGLVITPFLSEFDTSPLTTYFKLMKLGEMSTNPLSVFTPVTQIAYRWRFKNNFEDSAFNLGELLGLHEYWSLLPLMLILMFLIWMARQHASAK